ncbi:uncharacterized protein FOMMEDRAFT_139131 [Fomitiporia mediterranea MF3/22]|uniref:uncharacterized protein n=1 Tax=Fomitiporia mediterranea (strain MF3/22) TaxID=694068 RepID=UPI0004409505|nr:uncharacterized protein FOMMEDRAFT_139131 [Fomitiporia mediterranea MF3/22]EJD05788.1 hypothetical protein FOMMEDRAFT_139131 [Fomitiporia mediterranea MF3/22]
MLQSLIKCLCTLLRLARYNDGIEATPDQLPLFHLENCQPVSQSAVVYRPVSIEVVKRYLQKCMFGIASPRLCFPTYVVFWDSDWSLTSLSGHVCSRAHKLWEQMDGHKFRMTLITIFQMLDSPPINLLLAVS